MTAKAIDHHTVMCRAIFGVHLFKPSDELAENQEPLHLCVGNDVWIKCQNGVADVVKQAQIEGDSLAELYGRSSNVPEDWGVVVNAVNEITHIASSRAKVTEVRYLGHLKGPLVDTPATAATIGLKGPKKIAPRARK